jgi:hypothetical protein
LSVNEDFSYKAEGFSGEKTQIGKFCEKFKVAYELIGPDIYDLFYKYLPIHITGKARANLLVKQDADDCDNLRPC